MTNKIIKFEDLSREFNKMMLIEDRGVLRLIPAVIVANQLDNDPVWLMLVASSSGGKSELLQSIDDILVSGHKMVFPISDLTTNTFASGMKKTGQETSLLKKIPPGGILTFKDFTSMLSKRREDRIVIMSQMREIYDQAYTKETGTGETISWKGRVGAIAGATEVVYQYLEDLSVMGDRFVMYSIKQPDTEKMTKFVMDYKKSGQSKSEDRGRLKKYMKEYCEFILENMIDEGITLTKKTEEEIMEVADFCTKARSGVIVDYRRGDVEFVPSREMPIRMIDQLFNIAKAFVVMRRTESQQKNKDLLDEEKQILFKIAFDSIPIKRRIALKNLAKYRGGVRTKGLAVSIRYPSSTVASWLSQLNGLGICERGVSGGGNKGDMWTMVDRYRRIIVKYEQISAVEDSLEFDEDADEDSVAEGAWEEAKKVDEDFENLSF